MSTPSVLHPLLRKLGTIAELSAVEIAAIEALPMLVRDLRSGQNIVREGDRPTQCCVVLSGNAFRYKILSEGRRQILSFHIAGDVPDLQSLYLEVLDHSLATFTPSRVAFIPHDAVRNLLHTHCRVADAMWREMLIDASIFREWVANIGRRSAEGRLAHVLCEMYEKSRHVGLASGPTFSLPVTQEELGDAMGLSTVHVNRTMMELRRKNLIKTPRGAVMIHDWEGLKEAGGFDPAYLHFKQTPSPSLAAASLSQ